MPVLPASLDSRVRAVADAWTSLPPRARGLVLGMYYAAVLLALLFLYGTNPPSPPPFIYQGF